MTVKSTYHAGTTLPEIPESDGLEDPIAFLARFESPWLAAIGFPGRIVNANNPHHEWSEEKLNPDSGTVNGAQTDSDTSIEVATGHGARFTAGDIVQVNGSRELISVTSISTDTLTVVRGIRGTTAEAIADAAVLEIINNPALENETSPDASPTTTTKGDNYTEIFRDSAQVTRSMRLSGHIGDVSDELDHQVLRVQQKLLKKIARTSLNGRRASSNPEGSASVKRTMDGIVQSILVGSDPSITDAAGAALDEDLLNTLLEDIWTKGGRPTLLVPSPRQRRKLSVLLEGRQRYQVADSILGAVVERFVSDFGVLDVLEADKFVPNDLLLVVDRTKVRMAKLGSQAEVFEVLEIARTGTTENRETITELCLEAKNAGDGGHGLLHNLAT